MSQEKRLKYYMETGYQPNYTMDRMADYGGNGSVFKLKNTDLNGDYRAVKMITVPKNDEEARYYFSEIKKELTNRGITEPNRTDSTYAEYQETLRQSFDRKIKELITMRLNECRLLSQLNGSMDLSKWESFQNHIVNIIDYKKIEFPAESKDSWLIDDVKLENISVDILLLQEYIEKNLQSYIGARFAEKKSFTEAEIIDCAKQICGALCLCHSKSIIHRDIKPANILMKTGGGKVRYILADFGSAKQYFPGETMTNGFQGASLPYMSPSRETGKYGPDVDIYSLGKIMKYMLTGESPKYKEPMEEVDFKNANTALVKIILKACPRYKSDNTIVGEHYRNASELYEDLDALTKKAEVAPKPAQTVVTPAPKVQEVAKTTAPPKPVIETPAVVNSTPPKETSPKEMPPEKQAESAVKPYSIFGSAKYYGNTAEQGDAVAQYKLGKCYYYGDGVEEDKTTAVKWYQKSANQGYVEAQYQLGHCYYYGEGVPLDYSTAVKWYTKAAERNDTRAKIALGKCYFKGIGVSKNIILSREWFAKADALKDFERLEEQEKEDRKENLLNYGHRALMGLFNNIFFFGFLFFAKRFLVIYAGVENEIGELCYTALSFILSKPPMLLPLIAVVLLLFPTLAKPLCKFDREKSCSGTIMILLMLLFNIGMSFEIWQALGSLSFFATRTSLFFVSLRWFLLAVIIFIVELVIVAAIQSATDFDVDYTANLKAIAFGVLPLSFLPISVGIATKGLPVILSAIIVVLCLLIVRFIFICKDLID